MAICATGNEHSLFLDAVGSVWVCGSNRFGQLGLGDTVAIAQDPIQLKNLPPMISVAASGANSLFLDIEGSMWACGDYPTTGFQPTRYHNQLPKISGIFGHCGAWFFIDESGAVWANGRNSDGQLGLGCVYSVNKPKKIAGLTHIVSVAFGPYHTLFLDVNGAVWSCGENKNGELGLGDQVPRHQPEKIVNLPKIKSACTTENQSYFVDYSGAMWACGNTLILGRNSGSTPIKCPDLGSDIVACAATEKLLLHLNNKGTVFSTTFGMILSERIFARKIKHLPPIKHIHLHPTGDHHFLVDETGSVWSTGKNERGQLGLGNTNYQTTYEKIRGLPKLDPQPNYPSNLKHTEKDIFRSLTGQQNKQLQYKIISALSSNQINIDDLKQRIVSGVIPLANWSIQQSSNLKRIEELNQPIQETKSALLEKQEYLQKIQQEVGSLQQAVAAMEEEKETLLFFGELMDSVSRIQEEVRGGFEAKVQSGAYSEFSVDEVSFFLMVCDLEELVEFQRKNSIDGEHLVIAIMDVSAMKIKNTLLKRKLEFYLKILGAGLLQKEEILSESMIWRHQPLEKTLLLLKEWDIPLDAQIIKQKQISIGQLIFFNVKDFAKVFGVQVKELKCDFSKFRTMRKEFEEFLVGCQKLVVTN